MAGNFTNFAKLTTEQVTTWSRDLWKVARNAAFISRYSGSGSSSMIQRITELTKSEKGARAVITLLADLEGDGVSGDNQMEGREEKIKAFDRVIRIDQLRHANRTTGKMADQRTIVNFRENSRDQLGYWMGDRMDQLAFQTLAGVGYQYKPDGQTRPEATFSELDWSADVTAPSTNRYFNWQGATKPAAALVAGDVTQANMQPPTWALLVMIRAELKNRYMRGIRGNDTPDESYHVFLDPLAMAALKLDPDYLNAARNALPRSKSANELWSGTAEITIDGMIISEFRHVPHFRNAAADFAGEGKPGKDGCTMLVCGAQALGMADIGNAEWVEKFFDYDNQHGISTGKICGMLKPKFYSSFHGSDEDFGVARVNVSYK